MSKHTVYGISCAHCIPDCDRHSHWLWPRLLSRPSETVPVLGPAVVNLVGLSLPNLIGVDCRARGGDDSLECPLELHPPRGGTMIIQI